MWQRRHIRQVEDQSGVTRITSEFRARFGSEVLAGPFKGLRYPDELGASALVAKLAGTYESELHGAVHMLLKMNLRRIINIGSAEGYYAVGLARLFPTAEVFAFDADLYERKRCSRMAAANGVANRVQIEGRCDLPRLSDLVNPPDGVLIVLDCEGCEYDLLVPAKVALLKQCAILVELHLDADRHEALKASFCRSHEILSYSFTPSRDDGNATLAMLSEGDRKVVQREWRNSGYEWLLLLPINE